MQPASPTITVDSPAKINLGLSVRHRREDGFHELESVVCGVELFDRLEVRSARDETVALTCTDDALAGSENLAARAARHLAREWSVGRGASLHLDKRIPVAAGLGGGSGNAAAALLACNALWQLDLGQEELAKSAAEIGSDVPLFFALPSAKMTGRGDRVEPVHLRWAGWVVLFTVPVAVSTPEVYARWSSGVRPTGGELDPVVFSDAATARDLGPVMFNDLEPAVFEASPAVADAFGVLVGLGLGDLRVTGAGSTMFVLADERGEAEDYARRVVRAGVGVAVSKVKRMTTPMQIKTWE